ncbi:hypothetical protein CYMTET_41466 [Cymbomonas tetramitiformis]|uniref:Uncharacterized protein n=1 Tax=Cymbomonas tetramitiformis TaxID=36881 RepID=A0AAE0F2L7_9CHLO|nr:hypothetical protein CYMTET_41466 [Cymbomonas tetramitiformis]
MWILGARNSVPCPAFEESKFEGQSIETVDLAGCVCFSDSRNGACTRHIMQLIDSNGIDEVARYFRTLSLSKENKATVRDAFHTLHTVNYTALKRRKASEMRLSIARDVHTALQASQTLDDETQKANQEYVNLMLGAQQLAQQKALSQQVALPMFQSPRMRTRPSLSPPPSVQRIAVSTSSAKDPNPQLIERLEELEKKLASLTTENAQLLTENTKLQTENNAHEHIRHKLIAKVAMDNQTTTTEVAAQLDLDDEEELLDPDS